jgi:NADPH-dependent 2,4-dienoyl-CoA reductase/sulfur reductase-like enzyme
MPELGTEILVAGGGVGGVAAALAAASAGHRVVLTEETDWLGGQFTAQAVPPDENPWIDGSGRACAITTAGITRCARKPLRCRN